MRQNFLGRGAMFFFSAGLIWGFNESSAGNKIAREQKGNRF
jgi:hypothetical protein